MKPYRALLINFDAEVASFLSEALMETNFEVLSPVNGHGHEPVIKKSVDLLIFDYSYWQQYKEQIFNQFPVKSSGYYSIVVAGKDQAEAVIETLEQGVDNFFIQPLVAETLKAGLIQVKNTLRLRNENSRLIVETTKTRRFFEKLINSAREAIFVVNLDFEIQFCNKSAEQLLKSSQKILLDRNLQYFIEDGFQVLTLVYQQLTVGKKVDGYQINVKSEDGKLLNVSMSADFLHSGHGEVEGVVIAFDNTSVQSEIFNRMVRKEKFSTIVQLSNVLAHEIRNPINILSGRIQLLKNDLPENRYNKNFEIIERQIERISGIAGELFKFNLNHQDYIPETISIVDFLEHFFRKFHDSFLDMEIDFRFHPQDRAVVIEANRYHLEDAFKYLMDIIYQYSTVQRVLKIYCLLNNSYPPRLWMEIKFHFNSQINLEAILEPFKLLSQQENHSSFGIAIMHTIFANYGGKISVDNTPGNGKVLKLQFPVHEINQGSHPPEEKTK